MIGETKGVWKPVSVRICDMLGLGVEDPEGLSLARVTGGCLQGGGTKLGSTAGGLHLLILPAAMDCDWSGSVSTRRPDDCSPSDSVEVCEV